MTAEIAIMNKMGVALAADSKVTIGRGIKAFDTVTKIFQISRANAVALMVWGNPDFMETPIEVICKDFRYAKGADTHPTVEAWANDFIAYMADFDDQPDNIKKRNVLSVLGASLEHLQAVALESAHMNDIAVGSPEFMTLLKNGIKEMTDAALSTEDFLDDAETEAFLDVYGGNIIELTTGFAQGFDDEELSSLIDVYAIASLSKMTFSPASMGFAIVGYGEDESFPSLIEVETDGYIGDKLKLKKKSPINITRTNAAYIKPFAQVDMVQRFMNGADYEYWSFSNALFQKTMVDACRDVLDKYGADANKTAEVKKAIEDAVNQSFLEAVKILEGFQDEMFSGPIIDMVRVLPKDELPHLAESLVALTSLKRHVSSDAETVGGPIDVALISKGDGLIWIKRKHYFKAELNPQFFTRYNRGVEGPDNEDQRPSAGGTAKSARRQQKPRKTTPES